MQFAAIHKQSTVRVDSLNNFPNTLRLVGLLVSSFSHCSILKSWG